MEAFFTKFDEIYEYIIRFAVIMIELISAGIICFTIIKSLINLIRGKNDIRLEVSEGIALALEFKLGSEVLRTLIVRELQELAILGIIIVLMAALSIFVQWGIKNEQKNARIATTKKSETSDKKAVDGDKTTNDNSQTETANSVKTETAIDDDANSGN